MNETSQFALHAPRRNRYFYGKLLDVGNLQLEQCYGLDKRRLFNRLALGSGVLCGLGVTAGADGTLCLLPGVAIDGYGREIIVGAPYAPIDPARPTDPQGTQTGEVLEGGSSTIYLCYHECATDPTAVYASECDGSAAPAMSTTVEKYSIVVAKGLPTDRPPGLTPEQRAAIYPETPANDFDRRVATEQTLAITCADPPDMACVVVATVTLPTEGTPLVVDQYTYRAEIFSNTVLFELIAALADRVDACCAALHPADTVAITDGDGQEAPASQPLPAPVHLLVSDPHGNPVAGAGVDIATTDADAQVSVDAATFAASVSATTNGDGVVTVTWRLGSTAGEQTFTATLTGAAGGAAATAKAKATEAPAPPPVPTPPVVVELEPANASTLGVDYRAEPFLVVAFDEDMDAAGIAAPDGWLRAWAFDVLEDDRLGDGRRLRIRPGDPPQGSRTRFRLGRIDQDRFVVVVLMRGSAPEIVSSGTGVALDADYAGTGLSVDQLERLWDSDGTAADAEFTAALSDTGAVLPSGDGTAGGWFHAFFTVRVQ